MIRPTQAHLRGARKSGPRVRQGRPDRFPTWAAGLPGLGVGSRSAVPKRKGHGQLRPDAPASSQELKIASSTELRQSVWSGSGWSIALWTLNSNGSRSSRACWQWSLLARSRILQGQRQTSHYHVMEDACRQVTAWSFTRASPKTLHPELELRSWSLPSRLLYGSASDTSVSGS